MRLTATTPSKVNLYLDVLGRRGDGYHEIVTVFLPLPEPADHLSIEVLSTPGLRSFAGTRLFPRITTIFAGGRPRLLPKQL